MRTLMFSGYDDKMAELGVLTTPLMLAYASRHGFDFKCIRSAEPPLSIYWTGVVGAIMAFGTCYDRVIYLDCDQVITNPIFTPKWEDGFHVSKDWGKDAVDDSSFSMCGFVAGKDVDFIFQGALLSEPFWRDKPFPEQAPMQDQFRNNQQARQATTVHLRKMFNAVPKEISPDVVDPWCPTDFCAHLTMVPIDERVRLFHEIRKQAA